ncbi:MAG TPA: aminotransferase class I/II-fold pyridoxal phosphate-dependent enzyme, partial [Puia sp.]|nr:aminotransferase class I/II-fold pyridoxal phosphate-dependent enzyme [Puia sp.]
MNEDFLHKRLKERQDQDAYRQLRLTDDKIDFSSNDYLGVVKNGLIKNLEVSDPASLKRWHGATGSRLLSGNYSLIEETEKFITQFHDAEAGLLFNSGYDANLGLLSSIPQRGDTIIYDQLCHASIRDGIRLSFAQSYSFIHNDIKDLEEKLSHAGGTLFVVTESVFSMDGHIAPLEG